MGAIAYGLSVTHFVNSVGAKAGFAAIIAVALLVLLFFAQMRETASLRDRAAASDEHVQQLELRVAQLSRGLAGQTSGAPAVVPAPAGLSRSPVAPVPAAAAAAAVGAVASRAARPPSAPAGVGAPALSSATRLIPSGDEAPISIRAIGAGAAAPVAAGVGAAAVGGAAGAGDGASGDAGSADVGSGGDGSGGDGSGGDGSGGAVAAPPGPRPATAAGGANGGPAARTPTPVPAPAPPPPAARPVQQRPPVRNGAPRQPLMTTYSAGASTASRIRAGLMIAAGIAVVAIVVILLLHATSGSTSSTSSSVANTTHRSHHGGRTGIPLKPADVSVTVLNGTETTNLAHDITQRLAGSGYKTGTPATATDHTLGSTVVGYRGRSNRGAALLVARSLKLGPASVQPVGQSNLAVACPQTSTCTAQVIVTVGADLAAAAGSGTTAAST
jgi:hypothetical protein